MRKVFLLLLVMGLFQGCIEQDTDDVERKQTEKMQKEAAMQAGLPGITNFTEKKFAKMIYELRDKEMKTYSYFMDMNGRLHFLCNSIGYGLPASVQYVSPQKSTLRRYSMPQPEPNGLFMPDSLDATYVLCIDKKGRIKPVYSEPKLIVSPFELKSIPMFK